MATRTITGKLLRPSGAPWVGGEVRFVPADDAFTISPQQTVPVDVVTAVAGADGVFTVTLVSGLAVAYVVTQPDQSQFSIVVNDGGPVSLEQLRADTSISPVPPQTVEDIIEDIIAGSYYPSSGGPLTGNLTVQPAAGVAAAAVNPPGTSDGEFRWLRAGVTKWRARNSGTDDHWRLVNEARGTVAIEVADATDAVTLPGPITLAALSGSGTRMVTAAAAGGLATAPIAVSALTLLATVPFSGAASVPVDGVFTAAYANYRIIARAAFSAVSAFQMQLRGGGADVASADYGTVLGQNYTAIANAQSGATVNSTSWFLHIPSGFQPLDTYLVVDLHGPALADETLAIHSEVFRSPGVVHHTGGHAQRLATSYDGFRLYPTTGTITGTLWVFGVQGT